MGNISIETFPWIVKSLIWAIWLLILGFILFTSYLAIYHSILISTAQTTWEQMRRERITYLKYLPKGVNPFSKGFTRNWKSFWVKDKENWENCLPTF